MVDEHQLPERRACRLVGLSRDCYRHPPIVDASTQALRARIVEIAHERRRFGYRRIHDLLRTQFSGVNHKRVYRLYRDADLAVRRRRKAKRPSSERVPPAQMCVLPLFITSQARARFPAPPTSPRRSRMAGSPIRIRGVSELHVG